MHNFHLYMIMATHGPNLKPFKIKYPKRGYVNRVFLKVFGTLGYIYFSLSLSEDMYILYITSMCSVKIQGFSMSPTPILAQVK